MLDKTIFVNSFYTRSQIKFPLAKMLNDHSEFFHLKIREFKKKLMQDKS